MASVRCPECKNTIIGLPKVFQDTIQCDHCAGILRVVIRDDRPADVRLRKTDLEVPAGLPTDLEQVLAEAIACFESGSNAATVVLSGLFVEGLLTKAGVKGKRLVDMIKGAHDAGTISALGFHVASASRMLRNVGAHYSEELTQLKASDARLVLEMARKLATDVLASGALKSSQDENRH